MPPYRVTEVGYQIWQSFVRREWGIWTWSRTTHVEALHCGDWQDLMSGWMKSKSNKVLESRRCELKSRCRKKKIGRRVCECVLLIHSLA